MLIITLVILGIWGMLTIWAEMPGPAKSREYGFASSPKKVLVVYDPDPIYNLDEQLCIAFGKTLAEHNIYAYVATVKAANDLKTNDYDLYLFCANTYNWRPDRVISNFVKKHAGLRGKFVVALTLGSGSTKKAKAAFDKTIKNTGAKLMDSKTLWLLRPNDDTRMKEPNVEVAISITQQWAIEIAAIINAEQ